MSGAVGDLSVMIVALTLNATVQDGASSAAAVLSPR